LKIIWTGNQSGKSLTKKENQNQQLIGNWPNKLKNFLTTTQSQNDSATDSATDSAASSLRTANT